MRTIYSICKLIKITFNIGFITQEYVVLIQVKDHPNLYAIGIAKLTDFEKEWLKLNIRKLKNFGLTISNNVGYELSPLGN